MNSLTVEGAWIDNVNTRLVVWSLRFRRLSKFDASPSEKGLRRRESGLGYLNKL
jgi:hypothetical protein